MLAHVAFDVLTVKQGDTFGIGWEKTYPSHWHTLVCHIFVPFLHTICCNN